MRKISTSKAAIDHQYAKDHHDEDTRPRRVPGATVTAWHGSPRIDLDALFAKPSAGPTVDSAIDADRGGFGADTVSLSDGTRITFAI
jgi:hypothetical protein